MSDDRMQRRPLKTDARSQAARERGRPYAVPVPAIATVLALALLLAGCGGLALSGGVPTAGERDDRGAALAELRVDNRTGERLAVGYRMAAGTGGEVIVGRIEPRARGTTAPVPAGEPIVLLAQNEDGAQLRLPARSFDVDGEWLWVIPEDARFTRAADRGRR